MNYMGNTFWMFLCLYVKGRSDMIKENQTLQYKNVVSATYAFYADQMELAMEKFNELLTEIKVTPVDSLFYSINSDLTSNDIVAELFITIEENIPDKLESDEWDFRSYFGIEETIMCVVKDNHEIEVQRAYVEMLEYTIEKKMEVTSPFFNVIKIRNDVITIEVYLGVIRID